MRPFFALASMAAFAVFASLMTGCGRHGSSSSFLPRAAGAVARHPRTIAESAYPNAVLADSPVAYYRLDDAGNTMADSSPNALGGTYGSAIAHGRSSLIPTNGDGAVHFPGGAYSSDGIATVPPSALFRPSNITVEAWVQEDAAATAIVQLVSYGTVGGQAWSLRLSPSNTLYGHFLTTGGAVNVYGTTVLSPGTTYHAVTTYDGTTAKLYVNGALQGTVSGSGAIDYSSTGADGVALGAGANTGIPVFAGTLDDVSVDATALSAARIAAHYSAGTTLPTSADDPYATTVMNDSPAAYYRLDDPTSTLSDATANRLNGTYGPSVTHHVPGLLARTNNLATGFSGGAASAAAEATVPQNGAFQPTGALSVEAWIRETAAPTAFVDVVSYGDQQGQAYALQISPTNHATFWLNVSGGATVFVVGGTALTPGNTYHLVGTYQGTIARLFVNGTLDGSTNQSGTISYAGIGSYGLSIGGGQNTPRNTLAGTVDEVAVYPTKLLATQIAAHYSAGSAPAPAGPTHVANWQYACDANLGACVKALPSQNTGIPASWMASHVDWNVVGFNPNVISPPDTTSANLAAAGARHIVVYLDPNIAYNCPVPSGWQPTDVDLAENGTDNCQDYGRVTQYLHASNGSYAHAYQHSAAGRRLYYHPSPQPPNTPSLGEPLNIGDADVQAAFNTTTGLNPYATDVEEDDAGGAYNCVEDAQARCWSGSTYGGAVPPGTCAVSAVPVWCFLYGETATEWDGAGSGSLPQQKYLNDAVSLTSASMHRVIGNNGAQTDPYDLQWITTPNLEGVMLEYAWGDPGTAPCGDRTNRDTWVEKASDIMQYHSRGKYVVETSPCDSPVSEGALLQQIASHWIVYDQTYSIEALLEPNGATSRAVTSDNDATFPEESVVPSQPLVATPSSNDARVFETTTTGVFIREYQTCYQAGTAIGRCAAVVNATATSKPITGLTQAYGRSLRHNTSATWAAGGTPVWSGTIPTAVAGGSGVILAQ